MLFCKRLEQGTFELPKGEESSVSVEILSCLLQGIKLSTVRKRKRYSSAMLTRSIHAV